MNKRMKLVFAMLVLMLFTATGIAETGTGTAAGFHGDVTVTLTVEDNRIIACDIVGEGETPAIGGAAMTSYMEEMVSKNSIELDVFSGATITSEAVLEAAGSALEVMNIKASDLSVVETIKGDAQELRADVVVIGAGLSGLTAAVELQESGKDVVLLEKNAMAGGSSRLSSGYMASPSEQTSAEQMLAWMNEETAALTDRQTRRNEETLLDYLNKAPSAISFLQEHNIEMSGPHAGLLSNQWSTLATNYIPSPETGSMLIDPLVAAFEAAGGTILYNVRADELIVENGKVIGVHAVGAENDWTVAADQTVLATGGYARNKELVARFIPEFPLDFVDSAVAAASSTGDGLLMAEKIGADTDDIGWYMTYGVYIWDTHTELYTGVDAFFVDANGEAATQVNQNFRTQTWTLDQAYNETGAVYMIGDEESYTAYVIGEEIAKGTPHCYSADTVEELAAQMGVSADNLKAAIEKFNMDVDAKADEAFWADGQEPMTTISGKLFAAKVATSSYATQGGLIVDRTGKVLNTEGNVIDGLYAIGEVANGEYFNKAYFGGGMLSQCVVTALDAAADILSQKEAKLNDGVYSYETTGHNGPVKVTLTVETGKVTKAQQESGESLGIGTAAWDIISNALVNEQTIDVDTTTGATVSGAAFKYAAKECLKQAGADMTAWENANDTHVPAEIEMNTQVLVAGGGIAGLTTAISAAEKGMDVILMEKLSVLGGASIRCDGLYYAANTSIEQMMGIEDSTEAMFNDAMELFGDNALIDEDLVRIWAERSTEGFDFLTNHGAQWEDYTFAAREIHAPRVTTAVGLGAGMMTALVESAKANDKITILNNTEVTELVLDEQGNVIGAKAVNTKGDQITVTAANVMLATGGFANDADMLASHADERFIGSNNTNPNEGDGYRMAEQAGARMQDVKEGIVMFFDNESMMAFGAFNPELFLVTPDGKRFADESGHVDDICHDAMELGYTHIVAIFDDAEFEMYKDMLEFQLGDTLFKADTVEELAACMSIDPAVLADTITRYNDMCEKGVDEDYNKSSAYLKKLEGPFYAMNFEMNMYETFSGPQINEHSQVMGTDGEPIEGLYAAGGITMWQITDYRYMGCGTALNNGVVFGMQAVDHMMSK